MAVNNRRLALEMMPYTDINIYRFIYRVMLVNSVCECKLLQMCRR